MLRDPRDVDDAFQATFLILVRKAGDVRVNDSLGRWLYGVSRRVAVRARSNSARRAIREGEEIEVEPPVSPPDRNREELFAAVDEEIARLPRHYRSAVVLCDLDGLSHEAAARELGCAVGTVASRLSRGRERLKSRLTRRGLSPLVVASAAPEVSAVLREATARSARGVTSESVKLLIHDVLKELTMLKWKMIGLGIVSTLVVGGLATIASGRLSAEDKPPKSATTQPKLKAKGELVPGVDVPLATAPPVKIGDVLIVEALQALPGRPISGERIVRPDGTISLGFYGDVYVFGLNRKEIKAKVVQHLRKYLNDDVLGLFEQNEDGKRVDVAPADTNTVFVAEVSPEERVRGSNDEKLDKVLKAVDDLRQRSPAAAPGRNDSETARRLDVHERRLRELERRLDQMIKALESAKREP
jgi:RNA polymerase sigma factor (sigma-70 family)